MFRFSLPVPATGPSLAGQALSRLSASGAAAAEVVATRLRLRRWLLAAAAAEVLRARTGFIARLIWAARSPIRWAPLALRGLPELALVAALAGKVATARFARAAIFKRATAVVVGRAARLLRHRLEGVAQVCLAQVAMPRA